MTAPVIDSTAPVVGVAVTTTKPVVDPALPSEGPLTGTLTRTFDLGRLRYGVIQRPTGTEGTALLRDVSPVVDPPQGVLL